MKSIWIGFIKQEHRISLEKAIKLNDKCIEAYIGSADAYVGLKDYDMAVDILVRGFDKTNDETFHKKVAETNELQKLQSQGKSNEKIGGNKAELQN